LACFKSTAEVVALTGNVAEELRSCGFRNVHVIPNMISSEARPSPYLLLEPRIGLLMGRAGNPQKGFDIFLEALALRPIPGWKFRIVGPCADTDPLLRELVERHHLQAVVALLPVSSDPCGCIRQCSCVIMPSRYEALPMVALEALAMGRPLLASDADGLKNVVVDGVNGRVFAHSSAAKLAECLAEVCPDDESLALFAANAPASVTRFGRAAVLSAWLRYADSFAFVWR
jgi:glycosyltransferase involved in cell wall biosynthesis